jgi:hypothetical protein
MSGWEELDVVLAAGSPMPGNRGGAGTEFWKMNG